MKGACAAPFQPRGRDIIPAPGMRKSGYISKEGFSAMRWMKRKSKPTGEKRIRKKAGEKASFLLRLFCVFSPDASIRQAANAASPWGWLSHGLFAKVQSFGCKDACACCLFHREIAFRKAFLFRKKGPGSMTLVGRRGNAPQGSLCCAERLLVPAGGLAKKEHSRGGLCSGRDEITSRFRPWCRLRSRRRCFHRYRCAWPGQSFRSRGKPHRRR